MRKSNTNFIQHHNRCYGNNNAASKFEGLGRHIALLLFALLTILAVSVFGQDEAKAASIADKMEVFQFMEGEWEGTAEVRNQDGSITTVQQHEFVQIKLKGSLVLIEGTGRDENGKTIFNALATIFYDVVKNEFKMMAFRDNGQNTMADIEIVGESKIIWSFSPSEYAHIKYELEVDKEGRWIEQGFFSSDKTNWNNFFSMELKKKDN